MLKFLVNMLITIYLKPLIVLMEILLQLEGLECG